MFYAHYDFYADPVYGGGFANTKTLSAFKTRRERSEAAQSARYTPITRREAERFYGRKQVEACKVTE